MSVEDSHIGPELCGDSAAPYVLGRADRADEHEAFARHLETCAVCREEVAALRVVASALPAVAPQLSAPPELKQRVMASVREELGGRGPSRPSAHRGVRQLRGRAGVRRSPRPWRWGRWPWWSCSR